MRRLVHERSTSWQTKNAEKQAGKHGMAINMDESEDAEKSVWAEIYEDMREWARAPGWCIEVLLPITLLAMVIVLSGWGFILQYRRSWSKVLFGPGGSMVGDGIDHHPEHS